MLDGVWGSSPADVDAVARAAAALSVVAADLGDVLEALDVNPLIASAGGCVAVDCLVAAFRLTPGHATRLPCLPSVWYTLGAGDRAGLTSVTARDLVHPQSAPITGGGMQEDPRRSSARSSPPIATWRWRPFNGWSTPGPIRP